MRKWNGKDGMKGDYSDWRWMWFGSVVRCGEIVEMEPLPERCAATENTFKRNVHLAQPQ